MVATADALPAHVAPRPVPRLLVAALLFWALSGVEYGVLRLAFGDRPVFVHVRWSQTVDAAQRQRLEQQYHLSQPQPAEDGRTWGYTLLNLSTANIKALVEDKAAEDTYYIHRTAFRPWRLAPRRPYPTNWPWIPDSLELGVILSLAIGAIGAALLLVQRTAPRSLKASVFDVFPRAALISLIALQLAGSVVLGFDGLVHRQTITLLVAGAALLWAADAVTMGTRRTVGVVTLLLLGVLATQLPFDRSLVDMGDAEEHGDSRANFEAHFSPQVRYEKHLTHVILRELYLHSPKTEEAPSRALNTLAAVGAAWFVISALIVGFVARWSPVVMRYLALAVLAPATLLYFGWWEFGYLALNVATFPLLLYGLQEGDARLEAGSLFAGLGTALHGFGLLSIIGAWLAALVTPVSLTNRLARLLRIAAWATAAYVGWLAVYAIVLNLGVEPGPAGNIPWRPWAVGEIRDHRFAAPFLSAITARDLTMTAWVVGAPLLVVAL